jgi:ABC-type transport system involved in multi-copper enzyme maturation permease subunit
MSPIHDQSYRRYQGTRQPPGRGWAVIAWAGIRNLLARKAFLAFILFAWIPFIVRTVQIYVVTMYPQAGNLAPINAKMFQDFVEQQGSIVFFITIWAGAGLIASDRRANALQIYLSKPLLRLEYIGGKLTILIAFLLEVTLLPALLLICMQIAFSGSFAFISNNLYVIPAVILASLLRVIVAAFTMLALSSLSKSSRYVAVLYTGAIFFTEAVYGFLLVVTGSSRVAWVSVSRNMDQVTDLIFRHAPRYETPTIVSVLVLIGLVIVSISVLERRVRGVEVVK